MNEGFSRSCKKENEELWSRILNHPFIEEMGNLNLPVRKFKTFIEQDYQYLLGFIRCLGLFLAKSDSRESIARFRNLVETNFEELRLLRKSYQSLGYSKENLEISEPFLSTESYRSYLLLQGYEGTKFEILGVVLPCDWIFADIGRKLVEETPDYVEEKQRIYFDWIEGYASDEYQEAIRELRHEVDEKYVEASVGERNKFRKNFTTGLKFEHAFFESVYNSSKDSF